MKNRDHELDIKNIKIEKLNFNFWDFGSVLVSKPIHKLFMHSLLYMVCFDLSKVNYAQLEYWLKMIKYQSNLKNSISLVVLVGTRLEMVTDEEEKEIINDIRSKFPKHVFPQVQDIICVSCKTGVRIPILKKVLRSLGSHSAFASSSVSPAYVQLHMKIKAFVDNEKYFMSYEDFCKSSGILLLLWLLLLILLLQFLFVITALLLLLLLLLIIIT
jgi:hypothetical protein